MPLSLVLCLVCLLLLESRSPNLLGKLEYLTGRRPGASRKKKRTDNLNAAGLALVTLFARIHDNAPEVNGNCCATAFLTLQNTTLTTPLC